MGLDDLLIHRRWWTYAPRTATWIEHATHGFNPFEGTAWVVFAGLVLARFVRRGRSRVEVVYALAFFTFGLTDFREAYALDSWLIGIKALNLVALFGLRAHVIRRCHPEGRLY
ncbi:hypothetical protein [Paludisphaera mucosa]|uniref:Uncharacterized protein n=1 Tax=Paludisphaera mucosa TaxID=3030827 RepID=A0ABT6FBD5_9BACT|nr:hypothetical protein [Paludisphaera mucosa]MDG3004690.1 hypothetical protein [Paludisphaera mucosa]